MTNIEITLKFRIRLRQPEAKIKIRNERKKKVPYHWHLLYKFRLQIRPYFRRIVPFARGKRRNCLFDTGLDFF